jgi:polysaccharide biosynthesis/export protein
MKKSIYIILLCLFFAACDSSQKIIYLQDLSLSEKQKIEQGATITALPKDMISIIVSSKDPKLAALFNLPQVRYIAGTTQLSQNSAEQLSGYTIDEEGNIDFPVIGKLHIAGMTRDQIASLIKNNLVSSDLLKDPVVTVNFLNLHVSVLGEVAHPGQISISRDQINLLEALSMAGDLTIYGNRYPVYVIREENGERVTLAVDLRSKDLFNSPAYYLKQNDVIYVQPNKVRAGQSTINDNNMKSVSIWMSIASLLATISVLIFK